jgi:hypothetical protein
VADSFQGPFNEPFLFFAEPEELNHVEISHKQIGHSHTYQINISWERPEYTPIYYEISIFDLFSYNNSETPNSVMFNVSGVNI